MAACASHLAVHVFDRKHLDVAPKLAWSQPVGLRQPSRRPVPVAMRLEHALAHDDYLFLKYRR